MPGLSAWARVRDYRVGQIDRLANVSVYLDSDLTARTTSSPSAPSGWCWPPAPAWTPQWYDHLTGLPTDRRPRPAPACHTPDDLFAGAANSTVRF